MRISDWSSDVCYADLSAASFWLAPIGTKSSRLKPLLQDQEPLALCPAPRPGPAQRAGRSSARGPMARKRASSPRSAGEGNGRYRRPAGGDYFFFGAIIMTRSEEHTSELQSLMRISYAVFCLKKKKHIR